MIYKKYKLSDVAKVEISSVDKKNKDGETHVKLCNFTDVYHNWAITTEMADNFMEATANAREIEKFTIRKGQVAFTKDSETRDDIGIPTYIADDFENVLLGYHCALITPDESKLSGKYLNAFMHSDYIQKYFELNATGSGMRYTLSLETLQSMPLLLPSLEEQKAIGDLFSSIDRKIALNRAINQNLEALAKQLYDYWFVQFDFPNEHGRPYKSSGGVMSWSDELRREIPAGWNVVQLGSLIESNRGISYNTSTISGGGVPMLNLASFNVDGTYKHKGLKSYNGEYSADKVLKPFDLVMCNTQQTAIDEAKDIIGKAFLVPNIFDGDIVSSHHVTTLKCENKLKPYLAYLSNTRHFHKYATGCCSGTNIMGLDFSGIERYRMELPPKSLIQRFYDIAIAVEEEKCKAILENERLILLRDELLPLLMNGQVSLNSDLSNG